VATKDYPSVDMDQYTSDEQSRIKRLERMLESARASKKHLINRWRRNEELVRGELLKPFNLPKYKTRIEPNIIHSVVEAMYAILTDRFPQVDIMPKKEEQIVKAYEAQEVVNHLLSQKKARRAIANMKRDGLIYGNGFLKVCIIDGEIELIVPDPFTVYVDPLATSLDKAQCVIFATPTYVEDIKDKYGKTVPQEGALDENRSFIKGDDKYATDKVNLADIDSQSSQDTTTSSDYKGGQALLKEAFFYEKGKLMLATWAGTSLLQYTDSPYDFIPLVTFNNYGTAHSIWGSGEPEKIESLAVGSSIALSQGMDNLMLQGNPVIVMSKSLSKIPGNRMTDKPGHIVYTNGPHERVDRLPAGNISASTLPMAESMIKLADTVSGVHEVSRGIISGSVTASRAISQLQEASQAVIRSKEREIGTDAVVDLYKMVLNLIVKNYSKSIDIRKHREDGQGYEFKKIQPYNLDADMDFKYVPGSSLPESRASRFDEAVDLLQLGLLDQETFWRWTQKDVTKDMLNKIAEARAQREQQMQAEMETISNSTDENEIMESLLRYRDISGAGAQEEPEETTSAK
tara:strand:+ start:311 stop:2029 length:1719 start_codon:yes stop_codon:yes gene_type:complete